MFFHLIILNIFLLFITTDLLLVIVNSDPEGYSKSYIKADHKTQMYINKIEALK
jgi:hypothetical protein